MKYSELFESLIALKPHEVLGRDYFQEFSKPLNFAQFLLTYTHPHDFYPVERIVAPENERQAKAIMKQFRRHGQSAYLKEDDFIPKDREMEMEQMLRYIETPAHSHAFVECVFILNGTCSHQVGEDNYLLERGACIVIPAGIEHEQVPSTDSVCLTIKVRSAVFNEMKIPGMPYFVRPVSFQCGEDEFVRYALLSVYAQQMESEPYSEQIMKQIFQTMMTYIMQKYRNTMQLLTPHKAQDALMMEIINYIYENYQYITLYTLAEHFHLNHSYLSNLIHKQCGVSFSVLLREYRLKKAACLLVETQLSLNDICIEIGYKDVSQFIRNFKAYYNTTPLQYRKHSSERQDT